MKKIILIILLVMSVSLFAQGVDSAYVTGTGNIEFELYQVRNDLEFNILMDHVAERTFMRLNNVGINSLMEFVVGQNPFQDLSVRNMMMKNQANIAISEFTVGPFAHIVSVNMLNALGIITTMHLIYYFNL